MFSRREKKPDPPQGLKLMQGSRLVAVIGSRKKFALEIHHPTDGRVVTISWDGEVEAG